MVFEAWGIIFDDRPFLDRYYPILKKYIRVVFKCALLFLYVTSTQFYFNLLQCKRQSVSRKNLIYIFARSFRTEVPLYILQWYCHGCSSYSSTAPPACMIFLRCSRWSSVPEPGCDSHYSNTVPMTSPAYIDHQSRCRMLVCAILLLSDQCHHHADAHAVVRSVNTCPLLHYVDFFFFQDMLHKALGARILMTDALLLMLVCGL